MVSFIPILRLLHFVGLALLLGGTFSSIVLVQKEKLSLRGAELAWTCMHLVAAPGMTILLITGLLHASASYWQHFKGAGYMHAKVTIALLLLGVMILDMRVQKKTIKNQEKTGVIEAMLKMRQVYALVICLLSIAIMWMVSFRPF